MSLEMSLGMPREIILATNNPDKVREINEICKGRGIVFKLPPAGFNPVENGATFEENAFIKASCASKLANATALADDSGLVIDYLDGAPGLNSARYAENTQAKIQKVLKNMENANTDAGERGAKFVCAMVLTSAEGEVLHTTQGECRGHITYEPKGTGGFGYDPIFFVDELKKTMAQMSDEEKNTLSHRAKALNPMLDFIFKKTS